MTGCNCVLIRRCIDGNGEVRVSIILPGVRSVVSLDIVVPLVVALISAPSRIVLVGFGGLGRKQVGRKY